MNLNRVLFNSVILNLGCSKIFQGSPQKIMMPKSHRRDSDLSGLERRQSIIYLKSSPKGLDCAAKTKSLKLLDSPSEMIYYLAMNYSSFKVGFAAGFE